MTPNPVKGSNSLPKDTFDDPKHPENNPKYQSNRSAGSDNTPNSSSDISINVGSDSSSKMDGDHSAKSMDAGANSATNVTEFTDGIHEDAKQGGGIGEKETGQGTSMFSKDGAVGSQFKGDGNLGSIGNKIGGPFGSSGAIGKQFEAGGAVGGTFQELAKKNENH